MRKLVFKTMLVTLGVVIVVAIALLGVLSMCAPAAMCDFTYSLGMGSISAGYAYQEYQRSGDLNSLARSVELLAGTDDEKTVERFDLLYQAEGFEEMCALRDEQNVATVKLLGSYRDFILGVGVRAKYRLADTQEEKTEILRFALAQTEREFPVANPLYALSVEAALHEDEEFCARILESFESVAFEQNAGYTKIVTILKEVVSE